MDAEIIAIGDEIISGQLLDTNTQWLSQRLEALGIRVGYHSTIGDRLEPVAAVFRQAIDRADVVIATGGLGPTDDDLTREAIAKAIGRELIVDREALEHIRGMFVWRGRPMPERNERQARLPAGSRMVHNPNGTAPGIDLEVPRQGAGSCRLFALPGVPAEIEEMWDDSVAEALRRIGGGERVIRHRRIKCFGVGESQIEAMLPDLVRRGREPRVGINASRTTIILRITAEGATEAECRAAMEPTVATIHACLGDLVFGEEDDELEDAVVVLLRRRGATLATVEWGTAGLVAQWFGRLPDAEDCYLGGLVVSGEASLKRLLGVDAQRPATGSPGDGALVGAMAAACRERFASDYGLAVGRFPAPEPADSAPEPVGPKPQPVFFALASSEGVKVSEFAYAGHPATLRVFRAKGALNMVRLALLEGGRGRQGAIH